MGIFVVAVHPLRANNVYHYVFRMLDGPLFLLCLGDCSILLGLNVWFLIILSDLECDYINASSACNQLNSYILPEIVVQAIGMIFLTVNWHWILFALNIPLLAYQ